MALSEYVVLARKLRPMRFVDLVGQETVARALKNAMQSGRVAHAFLFAGSRGIGKTSTARILTKALNCLDLQDGEPCNTCQNCVEISSNASPDVYEIDAASNRGIDNIRELRENTRYAPAKCRYKTYIIDEVHMLTQESFNALLKTLEEPPPHIKFVLATTAPHKIPDTILSRCQRYDFPRIPVEAMVNYLADVSEKEQLGFSRSTLEAIARNAQGGMRDALTAMDQVVAFAGPNPDDSQVFGVLGLMDDREVLNLLEAVLNKHPEGALGAFGHILERGHDLTTVLAALLREIKDLSLAQVLPLDGVYFQDHPPDTLQFYERFKPNCTPDELQQLFALFMHLETQLRQTTFTRPAFEMALLQACQVEQLVGVKELLGGVKQLLRHPALGKHGGKQGGKPPAQPVGVPAVESAPASPPSMAAPRGGEGASSQSAAPPLQAPPPPAEEEPAPPVEVLAQPPEAPAEPPLAPTEPPLAQPAPVALPEEGGTLEETEAQATTGEPAPVENTPAEFSPAESSPMAAAAPAVPSPQEIPAADPRWRTFVQFVAEQNIQLAGFLRQVDVQVLGENEVHLGAGMPALGRLQREQAVLLGWLQQVFGEAFSLQIADATVNGLRKTHTLSAVEQAEEAAAEAAAKAEALADEGVLRMKRFFPDGQLGDPQLPKKNS